MTACMSDSISCLCNLEAKLIGLFVWKSLTCTGCACPVHFQDTGSKLQGTELSKAQAELEHRLTESASLL